jgi:hypothetical protein
MVLGRDVELVPLKLFGPCPPRGCIHTRKDKSSSTSRVFSKAKQDCKKKHWYCLTFPSLHNSMISHSNFVLDSALEKALKK